MKRVSLIKINEIKAKSVLIKTNLPGCDYVINPYNGCQFGCMYCYAMQIARWKHPDEEWGSFLDVKVNVAEVLRQELEKLIKNNKSRKFGSIFFSSVTDPYTSLEAKYRLTRKCLQVLLDLDYRGKIILQTKSPLVVSDIDLLKKLRNVSVGVTVTTLNDKVSRFLEVGAPPVSARIRAIEKLTKNNIATYAFIGPILPHFCDKKDDINKLLDRLLKAGVSEVWFEHINLNTRIKSRLFEYLNKEAPELVSKFESADSVEYRQKLDKIINECLKGRKVRFGFGQVIYHHDLPKIK